MALRRRDGLLAALAAGMARPVVAEEGSAAWPTRPVEIIVPYAPGGETDQYARVMGSHLSEAWRVPVVVSNRPGGAASIGAADVAQAAPDGNTLLLGSFGLVSNRILLRDLPYDPAALSPLSCLLLGAGILYVHPSVPARNAAELVAHAKQRPGALKFGSSGIGSTPHISAELFAARAGIEITHVPYRGTGPAFADLLGGHIDAQVASVTAIRYAQEGRIRAIALCDDHRSFFAPDVPTLREAGYDVVCRSFFGFFAPAATPAPLQARITADLQAVARRADVQSRFREDGLELIGSSPEWFRQYLDDELHFWSQLMRERNIHL